MTPNMNIVQAQPVYKTEINKPPSMVAANSNWSQGEW